MDSNTFPALQYLTVKHPIKDKEIAFLVHVDYSNSENPIFKARDPITEEVHQLIRDTDNKLSIPQELKDNVIKNYDYQEQIIPIIAKIYEISSLNELNDAFLEDIDIKSNPLIRKVFLSELKFLDIRKFKYNHPIEVLAETLGRLKENINK